MKTRAKSQQPEPYHHGNLRHELLAKALATLRRIGAERLSLRELAREVGVSQTAPYRHFPDKESLLAELAAQGFRELTREMQTSMAGSDSRPAAALRAAGLGYIRFAARHPEQYRLMFGSFRIERGRYAHLDEAATEAFGVLRGIVARGRKDGSFRGQPVDASALAAWSIVHGFASLAMDGRLPFESGRDQSALADQVIELFRVGIEASSP